MESTISSHNSAYALSTTKEEPCIQITDEVCKDCFNLISIFDEILCIAKTEGTEDDAHDVNFAINSILDYMKHQMRDYQQRKAKTFCFDNLNEKTGFWLKDFAQKVLPVRYREGQREYFGKKGMSLHIDVFFRKSQEELLKYVYFTCIFRCKQSAVDALNIGKCVLTQFQIDCPMIQSLYAKSENASYYHGNFILEALYKMCKEGGLSLLRYDFNEPCKGKGQCDRESAGAKAVINSYVSSGNDVMRADDVFHALHYGNGIRNAKVGVIEIDLEKSVLVGVEVKNISSYHSVKLFDTHMKMYNSSCILTLDLGSGLSTQINLSSLPVIVMPRNSAKHKKIRSAGRQKKEGNQPLRILP